MEKATIKVNAADPTVSESTAREAHRAAGKTFRGLVSGERLSALPKASGTYLRACVSTARRDGVLTLDAINGRPNAKASREDRIAWYLAADGDE